jgi:hypothetical protein
MCHSLVQYDMAGRKDCNLVSFISAGINLCKDPEIQRGQIHSSVKLVIQCVETLNFSEMSKVLP